MTVEEACMAIAYLLPGKEARVFSGHPWIFRSDIERVAGKYVPGDIVTVLSGKSQFLARAIYNPQSQIALRIMSYNDEAIDDAFIRNRVMRAIVYRRKFADLKSCRLIFAESDGLPAVIVDSFGGVLVLQCLSLGMERYKKIIVEALTAELQPIGIYERNDVPVRELEGLGQMSGLLSGKVPEQVEITENGIRIIVDVMHGQKTGYFLDQKENRAAIAPFAANARVLDCFTHTGGFALHAEKYGAKEVIGVDISEYACRCAEENAKLNGFRNTRFTIANVFNYLTDQSASRAEYDMIILDPPAFTKTRSAIEAASRGYKEINLRAMKMLKDGGYLVTCSCSQHIAPDVFRDIVKDAARDARVLLMQVEYRTQGRDHPILPASPETQYLKCGIFRITH
jgi:23S rRNA (cytosine1962-C5)-methyltransferase